MDLADLPAYLKSLQKVVEGTPAPVANAMASAFKFQVQNVALKQVAHGPGLFWRAAPQRPPAYVTGFLANSMYMRPASAGAFASASVGITANFAALQEFGGKTWPNNSRFMHWENSAGPWWKKEVTVPAHPYWRTTVDRMVRNGDFTRDAQSAFWVRVLPFFRG